jgi:hypothetical protein
VLPLEGALLNARRHHQIDDAGDDEQDQDVR